ncbi:MAG: FMN-binding negative transcriptional regulator [Dolichospermum sp. OL01]|nr:FMN-binding negative transcriptional regulator [Dolichospermum sp. OL01]
MIYPVMFIPKYHEENNLDVLHNLITAHPLGTWAVCQDNRITAHHLPFMLYPSRGTYGSLITHVSKANPVWQLAHDTIDSSLIIFQGANAYITPSWYASKQEHGKVVPTWNYAVVHVYGKPTVWTDMNWLHQHIHTVTDAHEANQPKPWKVDDAPQEYIDQMTQGIVGIEILIERIIGKWKVSQNRNEADRQGVIDGLRAKGDPELIAMADMVENPGKRLEPT